MEKNKKNSEITVSSVEELKNAAHAKYGKIIVTGPYASEICAKVRNAQTGDKASNAALIVGIFLWPALIGGIAGKIITHDLKDYKIDIQKEDLIVLSLK